LHKTAVKEHQREDFILLNKVKYPPGKILNTKNRASGKRNDQQEPLQIEEKRRDE
jgi:hypothetical protein